MPQVSFLSLDMTPRAWPCPGVLSGGVAQVQVKGDPCGHPLSVDPHTTLVWWA